MRYLFITILLLHGISTYAQQSIKNFWGIPFYSTKDEVRTLLKKRGFEPVLDSAERLSYKNVPYGQLTANRISFIFPNDSFDYSIVSFKLPDAEQGLNFFQEWHGRFTNLYGPPVATDIDDNIQFNTGSATALISQKPDTFFCALWLIKDKKRKGSYIKLELLTYSERIIMFTFKHLDAVLHSGKKE